MDTEHRFQLLKEREIEELRIQARLYRHLKTGAELLSLITDDENKVFGITFPTPPSDSTGVAHILEHSVLCGSRKYPVKEPFVELLKGSLQTFLNAFTYPDRTCYPVASQNLQDFYNLINVYLDAVFHPRLGRHIFQQEGWHYELEGPDGPLTYKGVVFNEMKGAYSSPDNLLSEYSLHSLFPDNAYGFDAGGDPKEIPRLTYEQFKSFHERYYHPSNARIYFYGDDDPDRRLGLLNEYLEEYEPIKVRSEINLQPPFKEPRRVARPFAAGQEEGAGDKGMVTMNWVLTEPTDVEANLALIMLDYILLGMPGSPLRKALIDSGLGEDIAGVGLENELRQIYFSTGLKGVDPANARRVESLILETLNDLVATGIDPKTTEAALNTIEFRLRENNTGNFPRGLSLMLKALSTWLYAGDPLALVSFEGPLRAIKSGLKTDPRFFEGLTKRLFLENPHRTTLILKPDPDLGAREEQEEKEQLARVRSSMSREEIEAVIAGTRELKRIQETPDPPEALAAIPLLRIEDLDRKNRAIPSLLVEEGKTDILFHDLFTNGITYLDIGFNLHGLAPAQIPYIPLFGRALVEMGTEREDFVALTQRISRKTGGLRPRSLTSTIRGSRRCAAWLFLRGKGMSHRIGDLVDIARDVFLTVRLDNRERFRQMVMEEKARVEQNLISAGHQVVNLRLRSHFGEAQWAEEQMGGITYLFFLRDLARAVDENWPGVLADLQEIHRTIINRESMMANVTTDRKGWSLLERHLRDLIDRIPEAPPSLADWPAGTEPLPEAMTIPSQVNYVGKGADLYGLGYRFHGSMLIITRYLRNAWLWDRVRVQGGAYGAFCVFDRLSGILTFLSYRDPNLVETIDAFDRCADFLQETALSEDELTKSIIGTIGDLDRHMLPDAKGFASLIRYLTDDTDEKRQEMRDEVLATRPSHFREMARVFDQVKNRGVVKILGSPTSMESVEKERPGWLNTVKVL